LKRCASPENQLSSSQVQTKPLFDIGFQKKMAWALAWGAFGRLKRRAWHRQEPPPPPPDSETFESGSHAGHNPRPLRFFSQFPLGGMPNNQPWKLPIYNDSNVADVSVTLYFCYGDGLKSMLPVLLPVLCQFYGNLIKTQHKTRTGIKIVESPKRYPARPLRCDP
jgi:hypothetical protein